MILTTSMESADTFDPTQYNIEWASTFWATGELVDASNFGPTPVKAKSWKHGWDWLPMAELVLIFNKFLYRCYKIWGARKKVVIFPATLVLIAAVLAFVELTPLGVLNRRVLFAIFAVTNMVLMGLTGDSICHIILLS
ncbi:hypothetical protein GGX14DRAFT_408253 [Mycena pura]|uniref:Uncharacterized protein n=1 Tax=Mycena pura TaxID=153505 RepID=A0AAD6UN86_9AGAR|nr:hypothetical protein GGX14DRAFT_408253 [Mycena pura]